MGPGREIDTMARGRTYPSERIHFADARTGTPIVQLTAHPTVGFCLGYTNRCFTPDSRTMILMLQRSANRDAPLDLFRVDVDGTNLTQLTECEGLSGMVLSRDGTGVFVWRDNGLWRVDMNTFEETELAHLDAPFPLVSAAVSPDGRWYVASTSAGEDGRVQLARFSTDGSEEPHVCAPYAWWAGIHSADPGGSGLSAYFYRDGCKEHHLLGMDFEDLGVFTTTHDFAHSTWLGSTGRIQGCGLPPDRGLYTIGLGEEVPVKVTTGPYFWHSCSSEDGEWIVADTNWPERGVYLVHVASGRYAPLCHPGSAVGSHQYTHPHPQFSPDGRYVLYNSDRTGITHPYLAEIGDGLRAHIRDGALDAFANLR